jgi:predicted acyl esterase
MNHGAAGSANAALMPRYRTTYSAFYFLSRGYAVVLPMMRGHAGSGGKVDLQGCNLKAVGIANAKDILAVMERVAALPYIDGSRIVVAGQSYGGWNTLALGTLNHPQVKGLINFVGGVASAQCPDWEARLPRDAAYFASRTRAVDMVLRRQ